MKEKIESYNLSIDRKQEFKRLYNKYVTYYNKGNRISITSELKEMLHGISSRIKENRDNLSQPFYTFLYGAMKLQGSNCDEDRKKGETISKLVNEVTVEIDQKLRPFPHNGPHKKTLQRIFELANTVNKILTVNPIAEEPISEVHIYSTIKNYYDLERLQIHESVLISITDKILDGSSFEPLTHFGELTEEELKVLRGSEGENIKPADKWDWIENEYLNNRENFQTDDEWAEATTEKFKEEFNTTEGSPTSMKRYGKYKGHH